jgi:hypothetical protein
VADRLASGDAAPEFLLVHLSAALALDLAALTEALDGPGVDIVGAVQRLAADAGAAVDSYAGLSVMITSGGRSITFTALEELTEPADIRTSLHMLLAAGGPATTQPTPAIEIVLYARTPGAFVDLAADAGWLSDGSRMLIDRHLTVPRHDSTSGLAELSALNQAVGVLIGRGRSPEQARVDIDLLATDAGVSPAAAAATILDGLTYRPPATGLPSGR